MRILCFFLLLSVVSCNSGPNRWKLTYLSASDVKFSSSKLYHQTSNQFHGLEFELLRLQDRLIAYLNVFSQTIPAASEPTSAKVTLRIDGKEHQGLARRLEGGQRLLLKEEMTDLIISSLRQGKAVEIILDGYEETITPEEFLPNFEKLIVDLDYPSAPIHERA